MKANIKWIFVVFILVIMALLSARAANSRCIQENKTESKQETEDQRKKIIKKLVSETRESLVGIEFKFKKKSQLEQITDEDEYDRSNRYSDYKTQEALEKGTLKLFGAVIEKEGTVLIPSLSIQSDKVEKITVIDHEGARHEAEFHAVLQNYDATLLKLKESKKKEWKPINFIQVQAKESSPLGLGDHFYNIILESIDETWFVTVFPRQITSVMMNGKNNQLFVLNALESGYLVANEAGQVIGITLDNYLWIDETGRNSFIGTDIVNDKRITVKELKEVTQKFEKELLKHVVKVEFELREDKSDIPRYYRSEAANTKPIFFGYCVNSQGDIVFPYTLEREIIKRIEGIKITAQNTKATGKFSGLFKDWDGFAIQADPKEMVFAPDLFNAGAKELLLGDLWFTVSFTEKFGKTNVKLEPNRVFRRQKSMKDFVHSVPRLNVKSGSWILSREGKLCGFYSAERKEDELEESVPGNSEYMPWNPYRSLRGLFGPQNRVFLLSELKVQFDQPTAHLDKKIMPVSKKEEGRRVWLGVEFQAVGKSLAQILNIEKQTKDGKQGLLITYVYPNSPAEKLGLKVEDILLSIKVEGKEREIELTLERGGPYKDYYYPKSRYSSHGYDEYVQTPWRSQKNYLNMLLTEIGEGKKITVKYLKGSEEKSSVLVLGRSPVDFESADKYKDEELGFTVKELTFEARALMKVDKDSTGVIVAKIESGSKAQVAKLDMFMIIQKVNGVQIKDIKHFEELIAAWKKSDAKSFTLEVMDMGQTRFIDVSK